MNREARQAFTIVELLVVIGILAILIALIVPAAQRVRETANRTQCLNNLRQIGIAFRTHEDRNDYFPDAGMLWYYGRSISATGIPEITPKQNWGWAYQILPYLDRQNDWASSDDKVAAAAVVELYFCPSRRAPVAYPGVETPNLPVGDPNNPRGAIDYAGNGGTSPPQFPSDAGQVEAGTAIKNGTLVPRTHKVRINRTNIPDGPSNTLLVGERNFNLKHAGDWHQYDENNGYFNGWDWDTIRWGFEVPAPDRYDDSIYDLKFGSSHHAGVNFLFADGSARLIEYGISLSVFQSLCARDDGQATNLAP
jgi:prepilin-type N-terminal cleavage/methylation domain-containing protein/prepilin-type processing-associated H-X9-DG protein